MSGFISSVKKGYTNIPTVTAKPTKKPETEKANVAEKPVEDKFVKSEQKVNVTYSKPVRKPAVAPQEVTNVDTLLEEQEARKLQLLEMIRDCVTDQANSQYSFYKTNDEIVNLEDLIAETSETSPLEEHDVWGIQAVADRIMAMAESFVGSDSGMFATIKQAVLDGFADAEKKWGGELPQICQDTMAEINNRFDAWEKELFGEE
ncbi:MAG: hypothetical protein IKM20_05620 [Erysipelotrichales bacterium]|nr:hypothetical protein [Erysipelotrichales bacterium]